MRRIRNEIKIAKIASLYTGDKSYFDGFTIFYIKGNKTMHILFDAKNPITLNIGDEVTLDTQLKRTYEGKYFYLVFSIFHTNGNYRKLPTIGNNNNTKNLKFFGYMQRNNGIVLKIGFGYRYITPKNNDFERYLTEPLRIFGSENIPKFTGDIFKFTTDLNLAAKPYYKRWLKVKLKYRYFNIILDDGNYIIST